MPSLLSRFLGKKKTTENSPLLDGEKFEAVPKTLSPSSPTFGNISRTKSKEKEQGKARGKRPKRSSVGLYDGRTAESVPVLSLSLPDTKGEEKKSQGLGVVFEGITDGSKTLDDEALGEKRLSPSETLILVQKTSEVLVERGLETLGVMRPHWFASPRQQEIQLKLIHRFIETQISQKSDAPPSSPTSQSTFESELRYARDPHDVAAVLRWGLRHLQLEGNCFGSSNRVDWYRAFSDSERSESYPIKAFDDILVPLLPVAHANLLRATLDLVSSLAAHSEENGISGNKLSKVLGWWVISSRNIQGSRWPEFYAQWEAAARQFEHVFLAYIRTQDAQSRMPKRLTELVKNYPFTKNRRDEDGIYLPRTRFSTRSTDALFIQITVDKSMSSSRPHPLRIVEDAFRAIAENGFTGPYATFWEELRTVASQSAQSGNASRDEAAREVDPPLDLSAILADESIRLFSLVPTPDGIAAPTLSLFTPLPAGRGRRSLSVGDRSPTAPANGQPLRPPRESSSHSKAATSPPNSSQGHDVTPDWQAFSNSGFNSPSGLSLAASLWDNDTEVSQPTPKKALGKRNVSKMDSSRPKSAELPTTTQPAVESSKTRKRTHGMPRIVTLDEAFIDFWADSLLDSIARTWPTFVVCQLKPLPALQRPQDSKPIEWLVIERVVAEPARPAPLKTSSASARAASPLPSPTKSDGFKAKGWTSSTLSATRKRWSFFTARNDSVPVVHGGRARVNSKGAKDEKVGEMGEILREDEKVIPNGAKPNGKDNVENLKTLAENPQEVLKPPVIQVNGVHAPEEPTAPRNANAHEEPEVGSPTAPSLSPIEEHMPHQFVESATQDNAHPSPSPAVQEATQVLAAIPVLATPAPEPSSVPLTQVETASPEAAPSIIALSVNDARQGMAKATRPEHDVEISQQTRPVAPVLETAEPQLEAVAAAQSPVKEAERSEEATCEAVSSQSEVAAAVAEREATVVAEDTVNGDAVQDPPPL